MEKKEYMGITGQTWLLKTYPSQYTCQERLKVNREILSNPDIQGFFEDSLTIHGMKEAIEVTMRHILHKKKIGIIGDYDVDGSSSVSMVVLFMRLIKIDCVFRIPNRFTDGYGPSINLLNDMKKKGVDLLLIADCGSTSFKEMEYAKKIGLSTIIIDHHFITEKPEATVILNPQVNQHSMMYLCSAGLTFMFLFHLKKALQKHGIYIHTMAPLLELAAMATVCDMVPLIELNRFIVKKGVEISNREGSLLSRFLEQNNKYYNKVSESYMGFFIGPSINSAGRFGFTELAVHAFIQDDFQDPVEKLLILNKARKNVEKVVFAQCMEMIKNNEVITNSHIIIIGGESKNGFFAPVLGIIAGKLKDRMEKSVFIVSWNDGIGKGSGRSFDSLHSGQAIALAKEKGIITEGGGHQNAAGFTISKDRLGEFFHHLTSCVQDNSIKTTKELNMVMSLHGLQEGLFKIITQLRPFGSKNAAPVFMFPNIKIKNYSVMPSGILLCTLTNCTGNKQISAICLDYEKIPLIIKETGFINAVCLIHDYESSLSLRILDVIKEKL